MGWNSRREFLLRAGSLGAAGVLSTVSGPISAAWGQGAAAAALPFRSAREAVAAMAAKQISAVELLDQAIQRIEALDGKINAVVVRDFERARSAARDADAALARGERGALLGLPMTVKESFNVAGLPTTWGFPEGRGWIPGEDALTVARLKAAGAVIIGKTNAPRGLSDFQSFNDIYGVTNNPWDVTRTPGGSSGGAAAALAAGFVALELGSDLGGSVRLPANFCGVFGHKPTQGLLPGRGQTPPRVPAMPVVGDLDVVGPLARTAADLDLAVAVLAGPDEMLGGGYRVELTAPRHQALRGYRVLILDTHPLLPSSASVRSAIGQFAARLGKAGVTVARTSPLMPDLARLTRVYVRLLHAFFAANMSDEVYRQVEAGAAALPASDVSLAAEGVRGLVLSHRDWIRADRERGGLAHAWRQLFREWDLVIAPVMPIAAFPHDHSQPQRMRRLDIDGAKIAYDDQVAWAGIASLLGLPATAAPIALSESGLPIGVQIIGPRMADRTTIGFASLMEREFGGFKPPPGFA